MRELRWAESLMLKGSVLAMTTLYYNMYNVAGGPPALLAWGSLTVASCRSVHALSALWTEEQRPRMVALSCPQVVPDLSDDEVDVLNRRVAELRIDPLGYHLALLGRDGFGHQLAVVTNIHESVGETSGRLEVQFDSPEAMAFAEVEGVRINSALPLLWRTRRRPPRFHAYLADQPRGDLPLLRLMMVAERSGRRRVPEGGLASVFFGATNLVPGARTVESAVVRDGKAWMGQPHTHLRPFVST